MEQYEIGKVFLQAELELLARKELNEDPTRTPKDIKALQEWIKKQPHLAKTAKQGRKQVFQSRKVETLFLLKLL